MSKKITIEVETKCDVAAIWRHIADEIDWSRHPDKTEHTEQNKEEWEEWGEYMVENWADELVDLTVRLNSAVQCDDPGCEICYDV